MSAMYSTLDVSRPDRSREASFEQPENMYSAVEMAIAPSIFAEVIELRQLYQGV